MARQQRLRGDAVTTMLRNDPKIAEWKARAAIDAHAEFEKLKLRIAEAERNKSLLRSVLLLLGSKLAV